MNVNMDALKALELKLAEYGKANGAIAEHESANTNCSSGCTAACMGNCNNTCNAMCGNTCGGSCKGSAHGRHN